MDRRIVAKEKIEFALAFIVTRTRLSNKLNYTDINIVAEDFFKSLLNILYKYDLHNANAIKQNETAIDIFFHKEKIAYQITSQNKPAKIKQTVDAFIKSNKHKQFSKFNIITITEDNKCNSNDLEKLKEFGVECKYINISDLEREILFDSETDKLELIAEFLEYETNPYIKKNRNKLTTNNTVNEKLKSLHIVDQMFEVLNIFDGFNCIYPRTIATLYPFIIGERFYDTYSHYCLKTNNIAIHELLQKVKVEKHILIINDDELKPFEEKLKKIFSILNHSLIRCICYREKFTEIEHHKINVTEFNPDCDCFNCQYTKFNIKPLFATLKEKTIEHSENLSEALSEGYYLCKLGEHIKGWQLLDSIATKSKEKNKAVSQFLALYNINRIRGFIDTPWCENEKKQILPKIDRIDLHNTLCGLTIPIEVRDELIKVKEQYFLNYSRELIDEHFDKILGINKLYLKGGYGSGSSVLNLVWEELHILHTFYYSNHIITDDFYTFKAAIAKGIEAILISYTTDERYEYRYTKFDNFILSLMVFYLDDEQLEKMFKEYEIKVLPLLETEKGMFLRIIGNFFSFQYTKGIWDYIKFNEDILKQDYFSHYRQSLRQIFNKVMLILSKAELSNDELKPLAEPITDFLRVAEDFNHVNWKYAVKFFATKIQIFNPEQIKTIIELTFDEKQHRAGDDVLESICELAFTKANFVLTDKNFFERLISNVTTPCKKCKRVHSMKHLLASWDIADESGKQIIKQKAIEYLEKKFDPDFYQHAIFKDIFTKDEQPGLIQQYISYLNTSCSPFDIREENGRWIAQSYVGFNCINCLAYLSIDFKQESIQTISKKSEFYNWLINYETYDYSNFNTKWLVQLCPYYIKIKLHSVKALKEKVAEELKKEYDTHLATFFVKYLN